MNLKITSLLLMLIGLSVSSCRENGEINTVPNENVVKNNLKLLKTVNDTIKNSSTENVEDPPKDPPKTGNNWKHKI